MRSSNLFALPLSCGRVTATATGVLLLMLGAGSARAAVIEVLNLSRLHSEYTYRWDNGIHSSAPTGSDIHDAGGRSAVWYGSIDTGSIGLSYDAHYSYGLRPSGDRTIVDFALGADASAGVNYESGIAQAWGLTSGLFARSLARAAVDLTLAPDGPGGFYQVSTIGDLQGVTVLMNGQAIGDTNPVLIDSAHNLHLVASIEAAADASGVSSSYAHNGPYDAAFSVQLLPTPGVPEPASAALIMLLAFSLLLLRRRRHPTVAGVRSGRTLRQGASVATMAMAATFAWGGPIRGDVMLDNLSAPVTQNYRVSNRPGDVQWEAAQFHIGATDATIDEVTIWARSGIDDGTTFRLKLYTDVAGVPGGVVGQLSPDQTIGTNLTNAMLTFSGSGLGVQAGEDYWLALEAGAGQRGWWLTVSDIPAGIANDGWSFDPTIAQTASSLPPGWTTFDDDANRLSYRLEATRVPEPTSAGALFATLFLLRRRRRQLASDAGN